MSQKDKAKETLKRIFRSSDFYILLMMVVGSVLLTHDIMKNGLWWIVAIIEIMIEVAAFIVIRKMSKHEMPVQKKFLFAVILLGGLFMMLTPPGQVYDEAAHIRRAYSLAKGNLFTEVVEDGAGSELPDNINDLAGFAPGNMTYGRVIGSLNDPVREDTFQTYTNTAIYNFVCYIPQTIGAVIGRILHLPVTVTIYLMRLFNFVVFVLLIYFAIKIIPKFKVPILFIALLPTTLHEAISVSPDALTIALSIFLVAYVLYLTYTKRGKMDKKELALLYAIAAVIGFCKIVYIVLLLTYLTIPAERFGSRKKKWMHLAIMAVGTLMINLIWIVLSFKVPFAEFAAMHTGEMPDTVMQLKGILGNPLRYVNVLINTTNVYGTYWVATMLGTQFGSYMFGLPTMVFYILVAMCVLVLGQREESLNMKKGDRAIFGLVFAFGVLAMLTVLYLQWTAVGASEIGGVQGRYFLPLLLLVPVMICRGNKRKGVALISERGVLYGALFVDLLALVATLAPNL